MKVKGQNMQCSVMEAPYLIYIQPTCVTNTKKAEAVFQYHNAYFIILASSVLGKATYTHIM